MASKTKAIVKGSAARRNPLTLNPLMKKSHVHVKSTKTERAKDKQSLKKAIKARDDVD